MDTTIPSREAWPVNAPTVSIFDFHIPKGYIYSAMAFSVAVEVLNIRMRAHPRSEPVHFYETLCPQRPKLVTSPLRPGPRSRFLGQLGTCSVARVKEGHEDTSRRVPSLTS